MPAFSQSRSNAAAYDGRRGGGGGKAGDHHKSSIDALLNPKHAGAQPYRLVLGEVRMAVCRAAITVISCPLQACGAGFRGRLLQAASPPVLCAPQSAMCSTAIKASVPE